MNPRISTYAFCLFAATAATFSSAAALGADFSTHFSTQIPMRVSDATTFYVKAQLDNLDEMEFMVDTGSSYTTINRNTLATLQGLNQAKYQRELLGVLANGTKIQVPVYQITRLNIGGGCLLNHIEAAVFPGKTRQILGLNALKQAGPFIFSFDPPQLALSNCPVSTAATASAASTSTPVSASN